MTALRESAGCATLVLALVVAAPAACGRADRQSRDGQGSGDAAARDTQPWIADTQYVVDSTGARLMIITGFPAGAVREVTPRAGSGDPDAPDAYRILEPRIVRSLMQASPVPWYVIDVRSPEEYVVRGHLPDARLVPLDRLEENVADLHVRTDQIVLVYADEDRRASDAARLLVGYGFPNVRILAGGLEAWRRAGLPVVAGST